MDKEITPNFRRKDRLIGILFDLGITSKEQIGTITGWTANQITGNMNKIRQSVPEKQRDQWIRFFSPNERGKFVYALGEKGIEHACAMIHQDVGRRAPLEGQIAHFLGLNDILCRLIRTGTKPKIWYSTKEASSYVYHLLTERELTFDSESQRYTELKLIKPKYRLYPDAFVVVDRGAFYIEYDTGSENGHKIEDKFHKYATIRISLGKIHPVVWVTTSETRKKFLHRIWKRAQEKYPSGYRFPEMHIFVAGEETVFLSEENAQSETQGMVDRFEEAKERAVELEEEIRRLKQEISEIKEKNRKLRSEHGEEENRRKRAEKWAHDGEKKYQKMKEEQGEVVDWFRSFEQHFEDQEVGKPTKAFRWGFLRAYQGYVKRNPLPPALQKAKVKGNPLSRDPLSEDHRKMWK